MLRSALTLSKGLLLTKHCWRSSLSSRAAVINDRSIELRTGLFGRLNIVSSNRGVEIASLDPHVHDDIGRVLLVSREQVDGDSASGRAAAAAPVVAKQTGEREWLIESVAASTDDVASSSNELKQNVLEPIRAMIPIPMDLSVTSGCVEGCSVSVVENRQIDFTSTSTSLVEFSLDRVKSADVNLTASQGSTRLNLNRTLLQTLNASARESLAVHSGAMYQGSELNLQCAGAVTMDANAIYCRSCSLEGGRVSLRCGSAHGKFRASSDGSEPSRLDVDSLEGSLDARLLYGDIRLHLTRPGQIDIDLGEGSIDLSLQPVDGDAADQAAANKPHSLLLDITAPEIDVESGGLAHLADSLFPLGPHAQRLVAELPCLAPLDKPADATSGSCCTVRLRAGRVRVSQRSASGLFAWLDATGARAG